MPDADKEQPKAKDSMVKKGKKAACAVGKCAGDTCKGFRDFVIRGNVVDLAVAIVVGTSFTALVNAFVRDFITPLIAAIFQGQDFSTLYFTINGSQFFYGDFINYLITFLINCTVCYFAIVLPVNKLNALVFPKEVVTRECPECLSAGLPAEATRCKFCGVQIEKKTVEEVLSEKTGEPGDEKVEKI